MHKIHKISKIRNLKIRLVNIQRIYFTQKKTIRIHKKLIIKMKKSKVN
jgi:hypothetical protein